MILRRGPGVPDADAVRRLTALLAQPVGGWLPPPEPDDAGTPFEERAAAVPLASPPPGPSAALLPSPPCPADAAALTGEGPDRSWTARPRLPAALPFSVRTGRFDPGRRGAAALIAVALLAALLAGGVVLRGRPQEVVAPTVLADGVPLPGSSPSAAAELVVAVAGKVRRPGLVRLPVGSRVDDALDAAGGPEPGTSTGLLNLARKLVDGEQVLVGVDPPPGAAPAAGGGAGGGLLDLNTATASDLDALPGIGPVLAQRIVDWRTENERFGSVEQLREVTGIGEAKYADLEAKVTV